MNAEKFRLIKDALDNDGAITLPYEETFLPKEDFERLRQLYQQLPLEFVKIGDAGEQNQLSVGRFMTDVERPQKVNQPISDEAERIVMSDRAKDFYLNILDQDEIFMRRMQVNIMSPGSYIGYHLDTDSNPDYRIAVILQFGEDYTGGDYVVHARNGQKSAYSSANGSVTFSNCSMPHEVTPIKSGERVSLVYFLSGHSGDNRRYEHSNDSDTAHTDQTC